VTAVAPTSSVLCAIHARNAESAPPEKATTTRSSRRSAASRAASSGIDDLEPDALEPLALVLGLGHPDAAHLVGAAHVRAAVSLLVETDDVDDADLRHGWRHEVHLGADELGVLERRVTGQELDGNGPGRLQLGVDELLHAGAEAGRQRVELEIHARRE